MGRNDAYRCRVLLWQICRRTFVPTPPWGGKSIQGFVPKLGKVAPTEGKQRTQTDKRTFFLTLHTKGKESTELKHTNASPATSKVRTTLNKYKIHIIYYSVFFSLFCMFSYCVINLLIMVLHEPQSVKMVKERVLMDQALVEEYGKVTFSRFWTGHINENDARIIINIKSDTKKNKKGKVIGNLVKQKDDTWVIKTLTYYTIKRNENFQTDDLKTLRPSDGQGSVCPVDHQSLGAPRVKG
ncbi:hypothetical protein C922_03433 [Plasmodium inui San Antonio 1]|uniref:Uncharacterized protein n=1 Tax=Plasmodium inui San Antonio 1 TaxID=1237626 RepID=W7A4L6_9APIC|nr:hypothetical protein C922_03433 [Plasmodium inui San Antonio 1]EUD66238.1 hypothetical protein C922_03433 [Plasmodium inui San Antonio 1]